MRLAPFCFATLLSSLTLSANSTGIISPISSQTTYSFVCASGANGQISYMKAWEPGKSNPNLSALVNGAYIHTDQELVKRLQGKIIEAISAGCQGETAVIFIDTYIPDGDGDIESRKGHIMIYVDKTGRASVAA